MESSKKIKKALVSVFYKDGLAPVVQELHAQGVEIYSTGGTRTFIEDFNIPVEAVEDLTGYPSILGGRVKTLHPKVFGGILARGNNPKDAEELAEFAIPAFDVIIVDLYPFEETVKSDADHQSIIEKIDIGGISLIRAAAKNYADTLILSSREQYAPFLELLKSQNGSTTENQRRTYAMDAFNVSSHYDTAIYNWFAGNTADAYKRSYTSGKTLRYGENPHQQGTFYGDLSGMLEQLHGKELSYNNLLDIDAAVNLIAEFNTCTFAILKHNNACGLAVRDTLKEAYADALAGDPVSAFGGVLITNQTIDSDTAAEIDNLFYEVLIAPDFAPEALEILTKKKNRILLKLKHTQLQDKQVRTILNGVLVQDRDAKSETSTDLTTVTKKAPSAQETADMLFASVVVKHTKSNAIVLAKNNQLLASGTGQTSRVDALRQAIHKAKSFDFELEGAVMASDAFFPFPDCVEIADEAGVTAVIQPGGSIRDEDSVKHCDEHNMAMVTTGTRHFKH